MRIAAYSVAAPAASCCLGTQPGHLPYLATGSMGSMISHRVQRQPVLDSYVLAATTRALAGCKCTAGVSYLKYGSSTKHKAPRTCYCGPPSSMAASRWRAALSPSAMCTQPGKQRIKNSRLSICSHPPDSEAGFARLLMSCQLPPHPADTPCHNKPVYMPSFNTELAVIYPQ